MAAFNTKVHPHRRYNPLVNRWVLVSPDRTKREWRGEVFNAIQNTWPPPHGSGFKSPPCALCPNGVRRIGEVVNVNEDYKSTYVFQNDFPALRPIIPDPQAQKEDPLFRLEPARGDCHIICYHPASNITLSRMSYSEIEAVLDAQIKLFKELERKWSWIQIFENKGEMMGCGNPHPHCQCWSSAQLPDEALAEHRSQLEYWHNNKRPLLADYADRELRLAHKELEHARKDPVVHQRQDRVVLENNNWVVVVPYWAAWPFETLLLPRKREGSRHLARLSDLTDKGDLAMILKNLLTVYDNLFECSFPYSMGWHGAPTGDFLCSPPPTFSRCSSSASAASEASSTCSCNAEECASAWQLHAHFYPPLLRSEGEHKMRKYMVGYEMLAELENDITPEAAAQELRKQSPIKHFLE